MGRDEDKEKAFRKYCHGQKRLDLGKLCEFIANQIRVW